MTTEKRSSVVVATDPERPLKKLEKSLEGTLARNPSVRGWVMPHNVERDPRPDCFSLYLWYPHEEKRHKERPLEPQGEKGARLARLKIGEANLLASLALELAAESFDVELVEADSGLLHYELLPRQ